MAKKLPAEIEKLVAKREAFRKAHNFADADKVRVEIEKAGYQLKDTSHGVEVSKKFN